MKNTNAILLLTLLLLNFACTSTTEAQQEEKEVSTVEQKPAPAHEVLSKADFKTMLEGKEKLVLIDVRRPAEFEEGHIDGAINVNVLDDNFKENLLGLGLDPEEKVLVYCRSGARSGRASKVMEDMGFKQIKDLKGGYLGWVK
ncbi:MAG: hypothetical protein Sapg2KO_52960 [Saprospiraceae bacterium]